MHSHPAGILYYLSDAKLKITYPDGKTVEREVKAGTAVWGEAVTFAAENVGATELHEVQTELKETAKKSGPVKKREKPPDVSHGVRDFKSVATSVWQSRTRENVTLLATVPVFAVEALISVSLEFSLPIPIACVIIPSIEWSLITDSLDHNATRETNANTRVLVCLCRDAGTHTRNHQGGTQRNG